MRYLPMLTVLLVLAACDNEGNETSVSIANVNQTDITRS